MKPRFSSHSFAACSFILNPAQIEMRFWVADCGNSGDRILFPSVRSAPLSTDGATYILQQAVRRYTQANLKTKEEARSENCGRFGRFPRFKQGDALQAFLSAL